ncbi:MAG: hypothetical protein WC518_00240 [Patescibacteria group bacterium]
MANNYIAECLTKFRALPREIQEAVGGFEALKTIQGLEETHRIKLGLMVILVAIGELKMEEIEDYLMEKYNFGKWEAQEINEILQQSIFEPALEVALATMPLAGQSGRDLSLPEQKKILTDLFRERLKEVLTGDGELVQEVNDMIFDILGREMGDENKMFEKDLEKILYLNQEKLTSQSINIDGRPLEPTVANWLRDFINRNGTAFFSNLVLSQYLANSENGNRLNQGEKMLLGKLLVLYRNLKFFPDNLTNLPRNQWEIIPISRHKSEPIASAGAAAGGSRAVPQEEPSPAWQGLSAIEKKALMEEESSRK